MPKKEDLIGKLKNKKTGKNKLLIPAILGIILLGIIFWQFNGNNNSGNNSNTNSPLTEEMRQKRVAVLVFENKTNDNSLEDFGSMISDWITRGLMETGEADVISATNIQSQIKQAGFGNMASPELEKATGIGVTVQGRYYLQEDQLIIHADVVNASNGKIIYTLDLIQGDKNQMIQ